MSNGSLICFESLNSSILYLLAPIKLKTCICWTVDFTGSEYSYNQPLSWNLRIKLALGAAKALAFLHDETKVIYRDFRAANILLDSVCIYVKFSF